MPEERPAVGEWVPVWTIATKTDFKLKEGVEKSKQLTVTPGTSAMVKGVGSLAADVSHDLAAELATAVKQTQEKTHTLNLAPKEGQNELWQWVWTFKGVKVHTREHALTAGKFQPPRCVPGYAVDLPTYQKCAAAKYEIQEQ